MYAGRRYNTSWRVPCRLDNVISRQEIDVVRPRGVVVRRLTSISLLRYMLADVPRRAFGRWLPPMPRP